MLALISSTTLFPLSTWLLFLFVFVAFQVVGMAVHCPFFRLEVQKAMSFSNAALSDVGSERVSTLHPSEQVKQKGREYNVGSRFGCGVLRCAGSPFSNARGLVP